MQKRVVMPDVIMTIRELSKREKRGLMKELTPGPQAAKWLAKYGKRPKNAVKKERAMPSSSLFISTLTLRNYKSIAETKLKLGALTFLVGPNGSGKSNCLDSLRFVAESLRTSLDHALRDRGTIKEVRRRSGGHPNHFAIQLDFQLRTGQLGTYSFRVGAKESGGFEVQAEECRLARPGQLGEDLFYKIENGKLTASLTTPMPVTLPDRLYLVAASGLAEFRPVFDALSSIEIYNINPKEIANMQRPDAGQQLRRDGSNAPSVFQNLSPEARQKVNEYLSKIVKGVTEVKTETYGSQETIEFRQMIKGQKHPWRFLASSMSDGTLRAFGILLSLFQNHASGQEGMLLVGLEEPEMALHPAASSVLLAALREASSQTQVLVTSHSPDLLDDPDISDDSILAVDNQEGITIMARIDEAGRNAVRDKLFTPGELLRQNQLAPDPEELRQQLSLL
jgi:predicted ATPase